MTVKIYIVVFFGRRPPRFGKNAERTRRVYLCIYHLGQLYEEATLYMVHVLLLQFRPDRI